MRSPRGSRGGARNNDAARASGLLILAVVIGLVILNVGGHPKVSGTPAVVRTTSSPPAGGHSTSPTPTSTTLPAARPPSQVKLLVANATSVSGAAGRLDSSLKAAGYNTLAPTNASSAASSSTVYYIAGYKAEAAALAVTLGLGASAVLAMPSTPPVASLGGADLVVVVGPDLANRSSGSATGSGTTTTSHP